jgi:hypothetical protein
MTIEVAPQILSIPALAWSLQAMRASLRLFKKDVHDRVGLKFPSCPVEIDVGFYALRSKKSIMCYHGLNIASTF